MMRAQQLKHSLEIHGIKRHGRRSTSVVLALVGPLHWLLFALAGHHGQGWSDEGVMSGFVLGAVVFALFTSLSVARDLGWRAGRSAVLAALALLGIVDLYFTSGAPLWGSLAFACVAGAGFTNFHAVAARLRREATPAIVHSHQRGFLISASLGILCRDGYRIQLGGSGDILLFTLIAGAFCLGAWLDWRRPLLRATTQNFIWAFRGLVLVLLVVDGEGSLAGLLILPDLWSASLLLWRGRLGEYIREDSFRNPPLLITAGFGVLGVFGAVFLSLPASSATGSSIGLMPAIFTSTSAICVTGLSVLDVGRELSLFGQSVLLGLIQLGGLGIITFSVFVAVVVGAKMGLQQTWAFADLSEQLSPKSMRRLVKEIVAVTLLAEGIGALALTLARVEDVGSWSEALWFGVFHSISAFCNAGFSLQSDSLMLYRDDPAVLVPISLLIILGGLGFVPLSVLASRFLGRRRNLNLHTQVALFGTALLLVVGAGGFWALQLGSLGGPTSLEDAMFWSVTLRTAGFNHIPMDNLTAASLLWSMALMFVGGCPGGTSGGVKVTTVILLFLAVRGLLRDEYDIQLFSRTVPRRTVIRALVVVVLSVGFVFIGFLVLLATQPGLSFISLGFEAVSAFGTVGLSLGATSQLDTLGALVIILLMFVGRVGPLALAYGLGRSKKLPWKGAVDEIHVG